MKTIFKVFAIAALAVLAICPLRAQTNPPAATPDYSNGPIRIDSKGVHIGGANPIEIKLSDFARREGKDRQTDWESVEAIFCSSLMPLGIVALAIFARHRRERLMHETVRTMIEKGQPVTPELLTSLGNRNILRTKLLPGLILVGVGAGMLCGDERVSSGALIVLFIGIAFLIVWLTERNSNPPTSR
jgi:Domain of unknown function (DUF6249)